MFKMVRESRQMLTGYMAGITYENIAVRNASIYRIDIQQDYLNGGPTGIPTNGVIVKNILMKKIVGTVCYGGLDVYIFVAVVIVRTSRSMVLSILAV
jgi:polygalacturonase